MLRLWVRFICPADLRRFACVRPQRKTRWCEKRQIPERRDGLLHLFYVCGEQIQTVRPRQQLERDLVDCQALSCMTATTAALFLQSRGSPLPTHRN